MPQRFFHKKHLSCGFNVTANQQLPGNLQKPLPHFGSFFPQLPPWVISAYWSAALTMSCSSIETKILFFYLWDESFSSSTLRARFLISVTYLCSSLPLNYNYFNICLLQHRCLCSWLWLQCYILPMQMCTSFGQKYSPV